MYKFFRYITDHIIDRYTDPINSLADSAALQVPDGTQTIS